MTKEQLSTLRKLAEEATYSPWEWCEHHKMIHGRGGCKGSSQVFFRLNQLGDSQDRDLQFVIAANPTAILELLDTLERSLGLLGFYANGGNPNYDVWVSEDKFYFTGKRAREFLASLEGGDGE